MSTTKQIKDIGVREFRDHATKYLSGSDALAIRKNGHLIGIYIPIRWEDVEERQGIERVERAVSQILEQIGVPEDERLDLSGLYWPPKRDEAKRRQALEQFGRDMQRIRDEIGMTEDEFADMFDLTKPFPE